MSEIEESTEQIILVGRFAIKNHPPISIEGIEKDVIWIETEEGEGTTIDVEKIFEWAM